MKLTSTSSSYTNRKLPQETPRDHSTRRQCVDCSQGGPPCYSSEVNYVKFAVASSYKGLPQWRASRHTPWRWSVSHVTRTRAAQLRLQGIVNGSVDLADVTLVYVAVASLLGVNQLAVHGHLEPASNSWSWFRSDIHFSRKAGFKFRLECTELAPVPSSATVCHMHFNFAHCASIRVCSKDFMKSPTTIASQYGYQLSSTTL